MKNDKTELLGISEEVKDYLDTPEGRRYFREITPNDSKGSRHEFKKSFLNQAESIRKHLYVWRLLENKVFEEKVKVCLDKVKPV